MDSSPTAACTIFWCGTSGSIPAHACSALSSPQHLHALNDSPAQPRRADKRQRPCKPTHVVSSCRMYSTSIISIPFCRAHNITAISAHVITSCLSSAVVVYYPQNILVDVSEMPCPVPQPLGGAFSNCICTFIRYSAPLCTPALPVALICHTQTRHQYLPNYRHLL